MVKKYFAVFLAVIMIITSVNITGIVSYAEDVEDYLTIDYETDEYEEELEEVQQEILSDVVEEVFTTDEAQEEYVESETVVENIELEDDVSYESSEEVIEKDNIIVDESKTEDEEVDNELKIEETEELGFILNHSELTMEIDDCEQLIVSINGEEIDLEDIIWKSSDEDIAYVEKGYVYAVSVGKTVVTASVVNNERELLCEIWVKDSKKERSISAYASPPPEKPLPALTGNKRLDAAAIAYSQVGYVEGYNNNTVYGPQDEWCAYFARWCVIKAGLDSSKWLNTGSTNSLIGWFQRQGRWHNRDKNKWSISGKGSSDGSDDGYIPQPGDFAAVENGVNKALGDTEANNAPDHTALVWKVDNNYIYTVEGNVGDKVVTRKYNRSNLRYSQSTYIVGFGEPDYGIDARPPIGVLDLVEGGEGTVRVRGWAFDYDNPSAQLDIHVFVGGKAYVIKANLERADVNQAYGGGVGNYHGFDSTFKVDVRGTQQVNVYAIDIGDKKIDNPKIGSQTTNIKNIPFSITYADSDLNVRVGNSANVKFNFTGDGIYTMNYTIDDPSIISFAGYAGVDWQKGNATVAIKALKSGTTTLYMHLVDSNGNSLFKKGVKIQVTQPVTGVSLNKTSTTLVVGGSENLTATVKPTDATDSFVLWESSDENVATVRVNGQIRAKSAGITTITATTSDGGYTATCRVTVTQSVTGVSLNKTSVTLAVGGMESLTATVKPTDATDSFVLWESSDENVAIVRVNGQIRAKSVGTAIITATTCDGGYTATCKVIVKEAETEPPIESVTGVSLNKKSMVMFAGETETLTATVNPSGAANKSVIWSSSNTDVATVNNNGTVTAKSAGKTVITVKTNDGGYTATCGINVITGIEFDKSSANMQVGETIGLNLKALPSGSSCYPEGVEFLSSNSSIVGVDQELVVFAKAVGTATIIAQTGDGEYVATCEVTVIQPATGISLDKTSINLEVGEIEQLVANIRPEDASDKKIVLSSNNNDIATVDSKGTVTAKSEGTAIITAKTNDGGYTAVCNVTVIKAEKVQIWLNNEIKEVGSLSYMAYGYNLNGETLQSKTWQSSDSSIITIDKTTGLMRMLKPGTATITLTINDFSATAKVKVISVVLDELNITLKSGEQKQLSAEVLPDMTDYSVISWESDNTEVATVNKGIITAHREGKAVITYTYGSFKAVCTVNVIEDKKVPVTGIVLNKKAVTMTIGDKETLIETVSPIDASDKSVIWSSSNPSIATVKDDSGIVTAKALGTAVITATTSDGGYTADCTITVEDQNKPGEKDIPVDAITLSTDMIQLYQYEEFVLRYSIMPSNATNPAVQFHSSDEDIVDVNEDGKIIAKNIGEADVTVTSVGSNVHAVCHVTVIIKQSGQDDFKIPDGLWISGLSQSVNYNGSAIKPEVKVYHRNILLREKFDYVISYKNNTKAGIAQIIVTGKGNYTGKAIETFNINAIDLAANQEVSMNIPIVVETGKKLKPSVTLTWNGKKLKEKKDYVLSYNPNIVAASNNGYDVTIKGIGNYTGSIIKKFYVKEKGTFLLNDAKVTGIQKNYFYDGKDATGPDIDKVIVKIGKKVLIKDTDYTIRLEKNNSVGVGTVIIEPTGKGVYAGVKRIDFNIIGTDLKNGSIVGIEKEYIYTGEPITPKFYVISDKHGTGEQIPTDSYTVSYKNNISQGNAKVTVTGIKKKGFSGSITATYKIGKLSINDKNITVIMSNTSKYAKGGSKPQPTITYNYNGKACTLREDVDYSLKYSNNMSVSGKSMPTLTITGMGNYYGVITKNYNIVEQDIGQLTIAVPDKVYNSKKKGSYYLAVPKVYDKDGKQLKGGKDYTVCYVNTSTNQAIGKDDIIASGTEIRVIVLGKENYAGTLSASYFIKNSSDIAKVKNDRVVNQQYTGKEIKPKVGLYLMVNGNKLYLKEGTDYQIMGYYNNVKKGTASILIKGMGAYSGSKIITFKVSSANTNQIWKGVFSENGMLSGATD